MGGRTLTSLGYNVGAWPNVTKTHIFYNCLVLSQCVPRPSVLWLAHRNTKGKTNFQVKLISVRLMTGMPIVPK